MKQNLSKHAQYWRDAQSGVRARADDGRQIALKDLLVDQVEFTGTAWRIVNEAPIEKYIMGRVVYIGPIHKFMGYTWDENNFKYYAAAVSLNNAKQGKYSLYGAVFHTDDKEIWALGDNLRDAKLNLALAIYSEYRGIIHAVARRNNDIGNRL